MKTIFSILLWHWIADSLLQSKNLDTLKSMNVYYIFYHTLIYILIFSIGGYLLLLLDDYSLLNITLWIIINGILHFIVDYYIILFKLRYENIGFKYINIVIELLDQAIHIVILLYSFYLFN